MEGREPLELKWLSVLHEDLPWESLQAVSSFASGKWPGGHRQAVNQSQSAPAVPQRSPAKTASSSMRGVLRFEIPENRDSHRFLSSGDALRGGKDIRGASSQRIVTCSTAKSVFSWGNDLERENNENVDHPGERGNAEVAHGCPATTGTYAVSSARHCVYVSTIPRGSGALSCRGAAAVRRMQAQGPLNSRGEHPIDGTARGTPSLNPPAVMRSKVDTLA